MNMGKVQRGATLADSVADRLRAQITSGEWPVGQRIPTEPQLVAQLGVARNTVREAVRALAFAGLLDIRQGSGTYVLATSEFAATMQRRLRDTPLHDVNELRAALETTAARLAATRCDPVDLDRVQQACDRRDSAWREHDPAGFAEADATFHLAVVASAHNGALLAIYTDLHAVVRDRIAHELDPQMGPDHYVDHSALVEALRAGDAEQAAHEAARHPHSWRPRHE